MYMHDLNPEYFINVQNLSSQSQSLLCKASLIRQLGGLLTTCQCMIQAAPMLNKIVFSNVGKALGGRLRMAFSGSSPLAPHIEEFLRVALCSFFAQGYGLTETCGSSFFSNSSVWVGPTC